MKKLIALSWLLSMATLGYSQSINDVEFHSVVTTNPDEFSSSFSVVLSDSNQLVKIEIDL